MSEPSTTERDRIEKLADSFMASYRAGERPSIEAYVQQYPELAGELRGLIAALIVLERNAPRHIRTEAPSFELAFSGPREIGEFTIVREIGRGGMGVVYEAIQQSLGRHVALKVLSSPGLLNPTHLERFRLEARSAGRLHHSHIVPVFGVGESDGLHYYAMQFIAGQSLDQVIDALRRLRPGYREDVTAPPMEDELTASIVGGLLSGQTGRVGEADQPGDAKNDSPATLAKESTRAASHGAAARRNVTGQFSSGSSGRPFYESVARVGLQVAEALAHAHAEGILHRDIKPSNLLLDAKGNTWVTDFGLVKADDTQSLTETGDFVGTLRYMAPERLEGWSDRRSDVYSLGATLYELLMLRPLFGSSSPGELVENVRKKDPELPSHVNTAVPRDLETIVLKALSKEPGSRYHTADEMAEDLRRFLADRPILARRSTPREQFVRWCRRNPAIASLVTAVIVALMVGTTASTWQAVRAKRAERLAEYRLRMEQAARKEADDARAAETEQRELAESRQAESEANFQRAKGAVDKYFTLVSESTLFEVPGLQPLRKDLLEAAVAFYEGAANQRDDDPTTLVEVAVSYLRLSSVYHALNRADDFVKALRQALDVIDQLHRDYPQSQSYDRKLAGFWKERRWTQSAMKLPTDMVAAMQTGLRLEKTWQRFVEKYPMEVGFQMDLAYIDIMIAAALEFTDLPAALAFHEKGDVLEKKLVEQHPNVAGYRANFARDRYDYVRLLIRNNRSATALIAAQQGVDIAEGLVAEFPEVPAYQAFLADLLSAQGDLEVKVNAKAAEANFRRSMELADGLVAKFPDQLLYAQISGRSRLGLCFLLATQGDVDQARQILQSTMNRGSLESPTLNKLSWYLVRNGAIALPIAELAVQAAQQASQQDPTDEKLLNTLGISLFRAERWVEAIASLNKAQALGKEKYLGYDGFFLAMAHWNLGHHEEARRWFDRSVEWIEKYQVTNVDLVNFRREAEQVLGIKGNENAD
ncbi:MAG: protein kinase [Planctomycetota bacterium]